ncbi:MAG: YaiI/YqxD family protein [Gammaproteobacteria bacterium]
MQILVDADACPNVIKEILFRAAQRLSISITLVANTSLKVPLSRFISTIRVPSGFDEADKKIVGLVHKGDLVITADIPLAAEVIDNGAHVLNPRGELLDANNIRERLSMRDFMDELRGTGIDTGGPSSLSQAHRQAFANQLDRFLAQHSKNRPAPD